jgi:hypothetical protein
MALRKSTFPAGSIVETIESHHVQIGNTPSFHLAGTRLKADHPAVKLNPQLFALAGTPTDEIAQLRGDIFPAEHQPEPDIVRTRLPAPIRDRDAVVPRYPTLGVRAGQKVAKTDALVKANPDVFVPVIGDPKTMNPNNSFVATQAIQHERDGVVRHVAQGEWLHRDDPLVRLHPLVFGLIPLEFDDEDDAK